MKLRYRLLFIFFIAASLFLSSCDNKSEPQIEYKRAFIMYLVADNNLSGVLRNNMEDAVSAVGRNFPENYSLYIYWDGATETTLYKVVPPTVSGAAATKEIVKSYDSQISVDPAVMKQVLSDVKADAGAESYGISFGSHATGWFPGSISINDQRAPSQGGLPVAEHDFSKPVGPDVLLTRSFGDDGGRKMSMADLVEGLSPIRFDYIIFDACFMSSVESLYDLRNSADYIVASPVEVIGTGYPFSRIIPELSNTNANYTLEKRLKKVAAIFVDFYRAKSGASQSGAMTLIKTSGLEGLAQSMRSVFDNQTASFDINNIQPMERITPHHAFFDLEDYINNVAGNDALKRDFRQALGKTVLYSDSTDRIYSVYGSGGGQFEALRMSGISSYIPRDELPVTKAAYMNTRWAKYIYRIN